MIDDGPPDRCGEICDGLAARDGGFASSDSPKTKVTAARNTAIEQAKERYITFVDADDEIAPDTERIYQAVGKPLPHVVVFGLRNVIMTRTIGLKIQKRVTLPERYFPDKSASQL